MKILFVHNSLQSFVKTDLEILRSAHTVRELNFQFTPQSIRKTIKGAVWADLVFCWFASFHCVLPLLFGRFLRKKAIIVGGDYDIIFDPVISAGWWRDILRRAIGMVLFPLTAKYVVNSEFSRSKALGHSYINPKKVEMIHHGFQDFNGKKCSKERLVITVSGIEKTKKRRKGLDVFVRTSRQLPDVQFALIGDWLDGTIEELRAINSENIIYTGFVSPNELQDWYARAKVYVQISYHEGFGCALAEAMVAGCIPVVTQRGAIPEVVGENGIYVTYGDVEATVGGITKALGTSSDVGERARERVLNHFGLEKRREKLLGLIDWSSGA